MESPRVKLTRSQMLLAAIVGVIRHINNLDSVGLAEQDKSAKGWQDDIDGACGEAAVAKWRDVFYAATIDRAAQDVGPLQVRTTPVPAGSLIVRPHDPDDDVYVSVLSHESPVFTLAGWAWGWEAKQEPLTDKRNGRPPAHFVSQSKLHSMDTLAEELNRAGQAVGT